MKDKEPNRMRTNGSEIEIDVGTKGAEIEIDVWIGGSGYE